MKIKLPKRFYTVEQLAERWECKVEDVDHLIETGDLKTTPYLAALHDKKNISIQLISDPARWADAYEKANKGETYDVVRFFNRMTKEERVEFLLDQIRTVQAEAKVKDQAQVTGEERDFSGQGVISASDLNPDLPSTTSLVFTPIPENPTAAELSELLGDDDDYPYTIGEAADQVMKELHDDGSYDPVITAAEVSRFEREHGEPTEDTAPPSSWPWGDYETPLLRILAEAVNEFCLDGLGRYPKKDCGVVVDWIKTRMEASGMRASDQLAGAMETLIAPRPYVHHRQRNQGKP